MAPQTANSRRKTRCKACNWRGLKSRHDLVRMRKADPFDPDFHLLEYLAKPRACVTSGRIVIWVYRDWSFIREIVLSGHAESRTCESVTSILIEAIKKLEDDTQWMLTCGAAYFRLPPNHNVGWTADFLDERHPQRILGEMMHNLQEFAGPNGLVEIIEQDWRDLVVFRDQFRQRAGASLDQIVLPDPNSPGRCADYLPVVPISDPDGKPLIFALEGWDFDCPGFQSVADKHLHRVQRGLLKDALRRRRVYRGWFKEWMEEWVPRLSWLPEREATQVKLTFPPPIKENEDDNTEKSEDASKSEDYEPTATAPEFLAKHAGTFLDRGQVWHLRLANLLAEIYKKKSFEKKSSHELDEQIRPKTIIEIDYERGIQTERPATEKDPSFTWRKRLSIDTPGMISTCMRYIRTMDRLIKPYEDLTLRRRAGNSQSRNSGSKTNRETLIVDQVSRQIVVETMIRGWPSFYLEDDAEREAFAAWADEYRPHVWSVIAKQARKAGMSLELLLEDNIVYDVRFNDDLGCTVQPLMLIDDAAHAQVHSRRAGASAAVAVWARKQTNEMPSHALALGPTNSARARELIKLACEDGRDDPRRIASYLRSALASHPPEAGKLILQEWLRRLGRDTSQEFARARKLIEAFALFEKHQYAEAKQCAEAYLAVEPYPVGDAYVLAALPDLIGDQQKHVDLREIRLRCQGLIDQHDELVPSVKQTSEQIGLSGTLSLNLLQSRGIKQRQLEELERFNRLNEEIERLIARIEALQGEIAKETKWRRDLIQQALHRSNAAYIRHNYPALDRAAQHAQAELEAVLQTEELSVYWSEEMFRRYGEAHKIVEVRGLFELLYTLNLIRYRIGEDHNLARRSAIDEMRQLADAIWLPNSSERDLKYLVEEFSKGDWDSMQAGGIRSLIGEAIEPCVIRMQDLLSDRILIQSPLMEAIATRIHFRQTLLSQYSAGLEMLLTAQVTLALAVSRPWIVLDNRIVEFTEDGRLGFDARKGEIFLESANGRFPLLRADALPAKEHDYIARVIADPALPARINPIARCVAEGLLAVEVEPRPEWRHWRDAMSLLRRELLVTFSRFALSANFLPELVVSETETRKEMKRRMDTIVPREAPIIDWNWSDPGQWNNLIPANVQRLRSASLT